MSWKKDFLKATPTGRIVWETKCGSDRTLLVEWQSLQPPLADESGAYHPGLIRHQKQVRLRGDRQFKGERILPDELISLRLDYVAPGEQLSLPLQVEPIKPPPPGRSKVRKREKAGQQLSLPLFGAAARASDRHLATGALPISAEELSAEQTSHYSLEQRRAIALPQILIDLLQSAKATEQEWESAIRLYEISGGGFKGMEVVERLIEGLPALRQACGTVAPVEVKAIAPVKIQKQIQSQSVKE